MPVLFAFRDDRFGFQFDVDERAVLGRSPECELIIFDRATSREHAEIFKSEDDYYLKDLGSTNGTLHNEVQVDGRVLLSKNDEIRVGQEIFLFDPDLDVSVGPEGAVLIVGDVEAQPEEAIAESPEPDMSSLDRSSLAPLFQVASALAARPNKSRVLRQSAYAVTKLFNASSLALLWPETSETERLTALLARPLQRRLILARPMVDLVINENMAVIWPHSYSHLEYTKGERILEQEPNFSIAVPLKAHGSLQGLLYVETDSRSFTIKDLNFLCALGGLVSAAMINATLIEQLDFRLARDDENQSAGRSFIGEDHQVKALLGTAYQVGQTDLRILVTGEAGTGKEVLARRIHLQSMRRSGPFIRINCSAYGAGQIERALFGQEAGTMSEEGEAGALEQADGGTVFIRHIDHLSLSAQVELLRIIEERVVYRIGSSTARPVNFRLVASTTVDLDLMVDRGEFREDLAHRLSDVVLTMPPLRELQGDIPALARFFMNQAAQEMGVAIPELDAAVEDSLLAYPWPGNVGELKNMAEKLVMFAAEDRIVLDDLTPEIRHSPEVFHSIEEGPDSETLAEVERILIRRALARANMEIPLAAQILGLSEADLEESIKFHQIEL